MNSPIVLISLTHTVFAENGTDCLPNSVVNSWSLDYVAVSAVYKNITYLGLAVVELNEVYVRYSDGVAIAFVIISVVVLAIIVALGIWTASQTAAGSKIILYSSPPFMFIVLIGAALVCVSVIVSNIPTDGACNIALWLVALGLNIMFSAIFAKVGRLWWILRSAKKMQRVALPNKTLFVVLLLQVMTLFVRLACLLYGFAPA